MAGTTERLAATVSLTLAEVLAATGGEIALLGAWTTFILMAFSNLDMLGRSNDWLVWLLQLLGAIVFYGAVVIMAWNAWQTWRDGRGWARRGWSVLMLLASLVLVYVAETFGLLAMTASY